MHFTQPQYAASIARLKNVSALGRFHDNVTEKLSSGRDNAFWDCQSEFAAALCPRLITEVVNHELQSLADNPLYVPEEASEQAMALIHTAQYSLEAWLIPANTPPPQFVRSSPADCMFGLISAGPASVELFHQPKPFPYDTFDRERLLVRDEIIELSQGESARIQAGRDLFAFCSAMAERVYLFFRCRPALRLIWEYSTSTLEPRKIIAADPSSSRLQYAARLLSAMSYADAVPNLFGLLGHPDHFVRWTAVQSLLALDLPKGLEALRLAENDKHSHVRGAAAKALRLAAIDQSAA